jgi:hypothetical protein
MSRPQSLRVMLGATVTALAGLLMTVATALAGNGSGPFPR